MEVRFTWTSVAPPTTVRLSDPTGTYGIRRTSDGQVIVEAGSDMIAEGGGVYSYSFEDPDGLVKAEYEVWITIVAGGLTYRIHRYLSSTQRFDVTSSTIDSPALIMAEILRTLGHASNPADINEGDSGDLFVWPIGVRAQQDIPDEFITAYDSGGVVDYITDNGDGQRIIVEHCDIQLRVRGKRDDYMTAKSKARSLKEVLTNVRNYDISVSSEIENEPPELFRVNVVTPLSKEAFIGNDDNGRPMFTVNLRASISKISN